MKKRRILSSLYLFCLTAAFSVGTVFGLASAYRLNRNGFLTALGCLVSAAVFSAWVLYRSEQPQPKPLAPGGLIAGIAFLTAAVLLRRRLWYSAAETFSRLGSTAASAYSVLEALRFSAVNPSGYGSTLFLALLGILHSWAAARAAAPPKKGKKGSLRMLPLLLLLIPNLVLELLIVDRSPAPWCLALTVYACLWLILSARARRLRSAEVCAVLMLPALVLAGSVLAFPASSYEVPAWRDRAIDAVKAFFEEKKDDSDSPVAVQTITTLGTSLWNENLERASLTQLGPQKETGIPVMTVFSDEDVYCYLFGTAYGSFEGDSWAEIEDSLYSRSRLRLGESHWITDGYGENTILIRTERRASICYLPYGSVLLPAGSEIDLDRCVKNSGGLKEYLLATADGAAGFGTDASYGSFVRRCCLDVPTETAGLLSDSVEELKKAASKLNVEETAEFVAKYVQASARYDLSTPGMPEGEDFVSWFLFSSETGYCVHFATATAVLLRLLGIPTRFVTGYAAFVEGGQWAQITEDEAHAWVEYYADGVGWTVLDATPFRRTAQPVAPDTPLPEEENLAESAEEEPVLPRESENAAPVIDASIVEEEESEPEPEEPESESLNPLALLFLEVGGLLVLWQTGARGIRHLRLYRGERNRRAVRWYYFAEKLAALAEKDGEAPSAVRELAEKARFSRNGVSEKELDVLIRAIQRQKKNLLTTPNPLRYLWLRLWHTL